MLDRVKVLKALEGIKEDLFNDRSHVIYELIEVWKRICADENQQRALQSLLAKRSAPTWSGALDAVYPVQRERGEYAIISVDGSQIYPDRHQGTACHLINIGSVSFIYKVVESNVSMFSEPYIFTEMEQDDNEHSIDHVNAHRQKLELECGYQHAMRLRDKKCGTPVFLFDGALIFWHLQSKEQRFRQKYLIYYMQILEQFYQENIPIAGYISLPKNKGLIDILGIYQEQYSILSSSIQECIDHMIVSWYLPEGYRSNIFYDNAPITREYPQHMRPCFLYYNTAYEIARIELPAWVAHDSSILEQLISCIFDQIEKGRGYPVCIAEAHEQAVVKGPDREFFYHLIQKLSIEQKQFLSSSKKSQRKKYIGF